MSAGNCGHLLLQKLRETCGQQVLPADRIKGGGKVNEKEKEQEQKYLEAVDVSYSYGLAKAMERIKSNPVLGFRTAGSRAEYETGEMLRQEMERSASALRISIRTGCVWTDGNLKRQYCAFRMRGERTMSSSWEPTRPSL